MYVFTRLKKKGERVLRKAGCGTWTGQNKQAVKNGEGHLIGYDRLLTFKVEDDKNKNDDHGNWTMHQYSLHPNDYNYAICKITKEENKLVGPDVVLQAYPHHQHMSNQAEPQADPLLDQEEEEREACNNIDPLAVQEIFDENVFNKVGEPQDPLLDPFTETLNMILEPPEEEEEREACDQIDALALKELSNENVLNKLAGPERKEDQEQVLLVEQEEQQVLLVEQGERPVLPMEQEQQQLLFVEQEEQRQERERMACITHLATNFNYYYGLQQQQLEGGEINSLGKRKNRSYREDGLSDNKKQQQTFVSSLY